MNLALRVVNLPKPTTWLNELAIAAIVVVAALLPGMGDGSTMRIAFGSIEPLMLFRVVLLAMSYGLVAVAARRHAPHGLASSVAVLWGAALGWSGWGWSDATLGWVLFAALVLLINQPTPRNQRISAVLVIGWALLSPYAIWGALLLLLYALQRWRDRPLVLFVGGLVAAVVTWLRGFEPWTVLVPTARPWLWADGQVTNKFGDPIGLALFGSMLIFVALHRFRRGEARLPLLPLAAFALFAWQARRNGIWLGFVAAPVFAALLADLEPKVQRWASPAAAIISAALLALALVTAPSTLAGRAVSQPALAAVGDGAIMYRPAFEQALLQKIPAERLILHSSGDPESAYTAWTRIATDCAPADELARLGATTVVLDTALDRAPIASLAADKGWRQTAADSTATVFVRNLP